MLSDFSGKVIMITGGSGSIGRECTRLLLKYIKSGKVIIFSRNESLQYTMKEEFDDKRVEFVIGDVRDFRRLRSISKNVQIVIHAAAIKSLPAADENPMECVKTNILGVNNIIEVSEENSIGKVLLLSSDKASCPSSVYGATKFISEKMIVAANKQSSSTLYSAMRSGNVMGSKGSVIPLFQQYRNNNIKDLPITHVDMTRFMLTLQQCAEFTLKCILRMHGGEVFVPKLPSIRIIDLAKAIIPDFRANIIGVRDGEKIHESMFESEITQSIIEFDDHFIIVPNDNAPCYLCNQLNENGRSVTKRFSYSSDRNQIFLSVSQICELIDETYI